MKKGRVLPSLLVLLILLLTSGCSRGLIRELKDPLSMNFQYGSSANDVLEQEEGKRLRADTYTPKSQQLMFQRLVGGKPFTTHYYFYARNQGLSGLAYYYSDGPFRECIRHEQTYLTLIDELTEKYGPPSSEKDESTKDPNAPWGCYVSKKWSASGMQIEAWRDGNLMHNFERVGVKYSFPRDIRE